MHWDDTSAIISTRLYLFYSEHSENSQWSDQTLEKDKRVVALSSVFLNILNRHTFMIIFTPIFFVCTDIIAYSNYDYGLLFITNVFKIKIRIYTTSIKSEVIGHNGCNGELILYLYSNIGKNFYNLLYRTFFKNKYQTVFSQKIMLHAMMLKQADYNSRSTFKLVSLILFEIENKNAI